MQYDPVFIYQHELRTVESESVLNKEKPCIGTVLPVSQPFFGTEFVYPEDAASPKLRERMEISFANLAIGKSSLTQFE